MKNYLMAGTLVLGLGASAATAQDAPFGTDADAEYAAQLWTAMEDMNLVGADVILASPYPGTEPHGMMLETFYTAAEISGHEGDLVVKRNYGPEGVSADEVLADPQAHLGSVTIMFRREEGYDPDNADWFWAKYLPDGSLDQTPNDMRMAGRVAKGADTGCIACHAAEDDYLYTTDHITQ